MTFKEIFQKLSKMGTAQNRKVYRRHGAGENLFGVSFGILNSLRKEIISPEGERGVNHEHAQRLWASQNIDAQTFATMIADASQLTSDELEYWVQDIFYYPLADAFTSLVYRTSFAYQKLQTWTLSDHEYTKRIGYGILNEFARGNHGLPDEFFEPYIRRIENELQSSPNRAKESMNNCLIAIGARNQKLRDRVLKAAQKIGRVEIDHGNTACKTFNIAEYLTKIYERKSRLMA